MSFACALVACGDPENLSVGEVRCEGVSCAPIEVVSIEQEFLEVEHVEREELLVPVIEKSRFCPEVESLSNLADGGAPEDREPTVFCMGEKLIPVGEEHFVVALKYVEELDSERVASGLLLTSYAGNELQWENDDLRRELTLVANFLGDSFEIARSDVPDEAIIGVTRETGVYNVYGQTFYRLTEDGELVELFEDDKAGRLVAMAALGEDIVVVSDYERRLEVTRYTSDGDIAWRQTTLALGEEWPSDFDVDIASAEVQIVDGQRILVLAPRQTTYQLIELAADGELVRPWLTAYMGHFDDVAWYARLATGPSGQFVVGHDGYEIGRGSIDSGEPRLERFNKDRSQYYAPAVLGLHVDRAGYIYIATIDGDRESPVSLLERISPDLSHRDSFVIETTDLEHPLSFTVGGELFVTEDQRALYYASGGEIGTIELPPIE